MKPCHSYLQVDHRWSSSLARQWEQWTGEAGMPSSFHRFSRWHGLFDPRYEAALVVRIAIRFGSSSVLALNLNFYIDAIWIHMSLYEFIWIYMIHLVHWLLDSPWNILTKKNTLEVWTKIAEARARGSELPLDPRRIYLLVGCPSPWLAGWWETSRVSKHFLSSDPPPWGNDSIWWSYFFQMGWNQPATFGKLFARLKFLKPGCRVSVAKAHPDKCPLPEAFWP